MCKVVVYWSLLLLLVVYKVFFETKLAGDDTIEAITEPLGNVTFRNVGLTGDSSSINSGSSSSGGGGSSSKYNSSTSSGAPASLKETLSTEQTRRRRSLGSSLGNVLLSIPAAHPVDSGDSRLNVQARPVDVRGFVSQQKGSSLSSTALRASYSDRRLPGWIHEVLSVNGLKKKSARKNAAATKTTETTTKKKDDVKNVTSAQLPPVKMEQSLPKHDQPSYSDRQKDLKGAALKKTQRPASRKFELREVAQAKDNIVGGDYQYDDENERGQNEEYVEPADGK